MPKSITRYRVFIASPQGLDEERKCFNDRLTWFSRVHGPDGDVEFQPVGWEVTIGGYGRPQSHINEDLTTCDYAVFVLHERWGSPPGGSYASGTSEEFALAERLRRQGLIKNIALFFREIDAGKLADPGEQLKAVLLFRNQIEREKQYLYKNYSSIDQFRDLLVEHLESWRREHIKTQAFSTGSFDVRRGDLEQLDQARGQGNWKQLGSVVVRNPQSGEYGSFVPI